MPEASRPAGVAAGGISEFSPVRRSVSLAEEVYEAIFQQLMALKVAPGARITVDTLVRELNVSHTPIREALGRLEGEGLVVKTHLVGYSAAPQISRRRFDDLYDLRLWLEPIGARRAAEAMTNEKMVALADAAAAMSKRGPADARQRYSLFARQDASFHDTIMDLAGNQLIRETLSHQHTHFHIFRLMFHARVTEEALDEHAAIIAAFRSRDPAEAEHAMRIHIERSRDRLIPAFE
jgi:DNA-binding GntR family transcriptional regulator